MNKVINKHINSIYIGMVKTGMPKFEAMSKAKELYYYSQNDSDIGRLIKTIRKSDSK